jgi:hypothetical protein
VGGPAYRRPDVGRYPGVSVDAMTLFGVGLIIGGVFLLGYAYVGLRGRARAERRRPDWSELDRIQPARRRGLDRLRGGPLIRRSSLLDDTVPVNQDDTVRITAGLGGVHAGVD